MNDLISRQAAINEVLSFLVEYCGAAFDEDMQNKLYQRLILLPSAEPEPKTGEWKFVGNQMYECTNCGVAYTEYQFEKMRVRYNDPKFPKFCPDCGSYNGGDLDE